MEATPELKNGNDRASKSILARIDPANGSQIEATGSHLVVMKAA
jgi:hypothetical protein